MTFTNTVVNTNMKFSVTLNRTFLFRTKHLLSATSPCIIQSGFKTTAYAPYMWKDLNCKR